LIERDEDARAHVRPFILTPSSGAADAQEKGHYAGPVNRVLRGSMPSAGTQLGHSRPWSSAGRMPPTSSASTTSPSSAHRPRGAEPLSDGGRVPVEVDLGV